MFCMTRTGTTLSQLPPSCARILWYQVARSPQVAGQACVAPVRGSPTTTLLLVAREPALWHQGLMLPGHRSLNPARRREQVCMCVCVCVCLWSTAGWPHGRN